MTANVVAKNWSLNEWSDGSHKSYPEPEQGSAPSWASALTVDAWTALSTTNNFGDVQAADVGQYGTTGPDSVFTTWNGAALVPEFGDSGSVLHWGGGHGDYYGNEVYCFDLATLTWSRLNEPTDEAGGYDGPFTNGLLSDGTPNVAHTYRHLHARDGKLVTSIRQVTDAPSTTNQISIFDPDTETWTSDTGEPTGVGTTDEEGSAYDSTRDGLWLIESDPLSWAFYDFSTGEWTSYDDNFHAYAPRGGHVYVPTKDLVLLFNSGGLMALDPANPTQPGRNEITLTTSGTAPTFANGDMARWSSNLGAVVYYPSRSNSIYLLTAPEGDGSSGTWAWSQRTLTGTSGTHSGTAGTYGKFNVAEWGEITVALVAGNVDGAVRAVRLV